MGAGGAMAPMNFLRDVFCTHEILKSMHYGKHEIFESLYICTHILKFPTHPLSSHPKCNAPRPAAASSLKGHVLYKRSYYHQSRALRETFEALTLLFLLCDSSVINLLNLQHIRGFFVMGSTEPINFQQRVLELINLKICFKSFMAGYFSPRFCIAYFQFDL